jgi:antitoxin MazE
MKAKLAKWGNSLAVRIPSPLVAEASLMAGNSFDVEFSEGCLRLIPVSENPSLDDLLAQITPENCHQESDWGTPVGKEVW